MNKVMCNWSPHCDSKTCPHKIPHYSHPTPTSGSTPQCEDKNTYCYSQERAVNCVEVKEERMNTNQRRAIRLANGILRDMAGCIATDIQKRENVCFLPRQKARPGKCRDCQYWKG